MSKKHVKAKLAQKTETIGSWDAAISDAEKKIRYLRLRIRQLKGAILTFRDRRNSGDQFPGEVSQTKQRAKAA